ncbi:DUF998 domain-containing protein [Erwinia sp. P7711]|uniref:DUF998 domain-containing protein n=1 Tax=Erwinia sp. P7711 TaxID=3141451 RepID=UPI003197E765
MNMQNRWKKLAALSFALGGLQYLLAEKIAALAWSAPLYHYGLNYISDLGIPRCGMLSDGRAVCSPLHTVMNIGFAVEGLLFFTACLLLREVFNGAGKMLFLLTALLHGLGGIIIALFHSGSGEAGFTLHEAGAVMAIGGGNLCLITVGWLMRHRTEMRDYTLFSLFMGSFGLLCMVIIPLDLLPTGLIERASVYPITFWQIFTGCMLLTASPSKISGGTRL